MRMMKNVFINEWLLLLRNKFFTVPLIINIICWGYIIISYEIQPIHYEETAAVFYRGFMWMIMLNLLIVGLIAIYMAGKDRESKFEQLVVTYQVKNTEWLIAKWLITQLYGFAITVFTLIVQAIWFSSANMAIGEITKNLLYLFVQMEGAIFLFISIGFLFGTMIKNMFAYLFIPVLLLLSLMLPFDKTGNSLPFDNPRFHLLTPFDYMFLQTPYEGIWGIHRVFETTILHQMCAFLIGMFMTLGTLLLFRKNRRSKKESRIVPVLMIIFIIPTIIFSGTRYMQYNQALKQYITIGNYYTPTFSEGDEDADDHWNDVYYKEHLDDQPYEFSIEKENLTVQLQSNHKISVQSELIIKNNGNEPVKDVYLTLFHGLKVFECTSSSEVTCSRDSDFITLRFAQEIEPEEEVELSLYYQGEILQYRDDAYIEQAFIDTNRVYLPKEAGWYPLIGKRPLGMAYEHNNRFVQFEMRNGRLVEDYPTDFTVEITNENLKVPLALTIPEVGKSTYQGTSQYGLSLIGGNFKEMKVDDIRVIAHPELLQGAEETIHNYQKAWSFMEEWLEIPMTPSTIFILSDWHYYLTHNTVNHDFFTLNSGAISDEEITYDILNDIMRERAMEYSENVNILHYALGWAIKNHLQKQDHFSEWYKSIWGLEDQEDEGVKLVNLLAEYEEKDIDQFLDAVKFLYHHWQKLDDKQDFDMKAALKQYERESGQ